MNNPEAKFILAGYRPRGQDAADPMFGAALRQSQADPALGAWFARAQAHDAAVADRLAQIAPPAGLREAILAGARVSGEPTKSWRRPVWLALAAAVAVLLGVAALLRPSRAAAENELANLALADTAKARHGGHGPEAGVLQALLSQPATRLGRGLPVDFSTLKATGCRTLRWAGRDVLEVCFARNGQVFHLYVVNSAERAKLPQAETPAVTQRGDLFCAAWGGEDGRHEFMLVSSAGPEAIRALL
jgi:hypothetical protein